MYIPPNVEFKQMIWSPSGSELCTQWILPLDVVYHLHNAHCIL